jgi:hypothetical protein
MSNALTQYLELYRAQRATIHGHSPAALNALRPAALQSLEATPLPRKGQEDYEAFDLEAVLAPDYGVNINRLEFAGHDVDHGCTVPNLSTRLYTIVGDTFHASRPAHADDEVLVTSLAQAPEQLLAEHYGSVATLQRPIVALNTLLAQDGLLVHAPAGKVTHRPLQVVNIFNAAAPVMAVRRTLIVAEPGSHVQVLVCDHTQHAEQDYLSVQVVEIIAMEGATVEYYDMEESTPRTHRLSSLHVRQHEGSNVLVNGITLTDFGPDYVIGSVHVTVDGQMTVADFDPIARDIQNRVFESCNVLLSGVTPYADTPDDEDTKGMRAAIGRLVWAQDKVVDLRGLYVDTSTSFARFDVIVELGTKDIFDRRDEIAAACEREFPGWTFEVRVLPAIGD